MPTERLCGLKTGQILLKRGRIGQDEGIDVSVGGSKGWVRAFAPTHHMARAYKNGRMGRHTMNRNYRNLLDSTPMIVWKRLRDLGREGKEVVLLCACDYPGDFCYIEDLIRYATTRWPHAFRSE